MNVATAERCGIKHLIDYRAGGVAKGVGTTRILGRVHLAEMIIGGAHLYCTVTIIDHQSIEFILGLDMLRRHQCILDLSQNTLRVGEYSTRFLTETQIQYGTTDVGQLIEDDLHAHHVGDQGVRKPIGSLSTSTVTTPYRTPSQHSREQNRMENPVLSEIDGDTVDASAETFHNSDFHTTPSSAGYDFLFGKYCESCPVCCYKFTCLS